MFKLNIQNAFRKIAHLITRSGVCLIRELVLFFPVPRAISAQLASFWRFLANYRYDATLQGRGHHTIDGVVDRTYTTPQWKDLGGDCGVRPAQRELVLPGAQRPPPRKGRAALSGPAWRAAAYHRRRGARSFPQSSDAGIGLVAIARGREQPGGAVRSRLSLCETVAEFPAAAQSRFGGSFTAATVAAGPRQFRPRSCDTTQAVALHGRYQVGAVRTRETTRS